MSVPDDEGGVVDSIVGHPVGPVDRTRYGGSHEPPLSSPSTSPGAPESPNPVACSPARPRSTMFGTLASAAGYTARTFLTPPGLRGLAVEAAWCTAHLAAYPWGLVREPLRTDGSYAHHRTDSLSPVQRSLVVTDMAAAGTPILLVHGFMDNRSVFTVFRRALRRRGFGVVHAVNYSLLTALTGDIRVAALQLREHVERLRERTGSDHVHVVGHSLGGLIARYYVQRLGGDDAVHTVVTLGSPHGGSVAAYLMPTSLTRQLMPGSDLLTELAEPAPRCRTRFLVVWSRLDQLIVPQRNARLVHPDLDVRTLELRDVGHMSLSIHPRAVHWVASSLARLEDLANERPSERGGRAIDTGLRHAASGFALPEQGG
ncbi:MAG TPA: alpha/beta fold hydrolase [Pseudonocardia sp.]|jgi:triacylglycerol lipase|uniref:esterase/lipase family protein n=1 Tax=Pseudonocardia sp. TaxID=60912 RepID=UPI002ED7AC56